MHVSVQMHVSVYTGNTTAGLYSALMMFVTKALQMTCIKNKKNKKINDLRGIVLGVDDVRDKGAADDLHKK